MTSEESLYEQMVNPELYIIDELEKIKAEIETYRSCLIPYVNDENDYCSGRVFSYDVVSALLEKHIEELKGENNANGNL